MAGLVAVDFGLLSLPAIVFIAALFGLYLAWTIGANDVANAMGTSVGSKALSLRNAIIVAAVLEFAGAVLAGGSVTSTVKGDIVTPDAAFIRPTSAGNGTVDGMNATLSSAPAGFDFAPDLYVYGMLAALLGTALWLTVATWWGMPVSTTHSIIGGVMGAGMFALGSTLGWAEATQAVNWDTVLEIFASWVVTPLLAGLIAFGLFWFIKIMIFNSTDPLSAVDRWRWLFIFLDVLIIAMATLIKGLKNVDWYKQIGWTEPGHVWKAWVASFVVAGVVTLVTEIIIRRRNRGQPHPTTVHAGSDRETYRLVEKRFIALQIVTAGSVAFAHGANDVANAIGPLAGIVSTANTGVFAAKAPIEWWILPLGGIGIVIGLATWGWRVMQTIGRKIAEITPSRGFSAELAAAATIILATVRELPVSTSQTLVGAVLGVGLARGVAAIDLKVLRDILFSWALTLPAAALFSGTLYLIFKNTLAA